MKKRSQGALTPALSPWEREEEVGYSDLGENGFGIDAAFGL